MVDGTHSIRHSHKLPARFTKPNAKSQMARTGSGGGGGRSPIHGLWLFLRHTGIVPGKSHEAMDPFIFSIFVFEAYCKPRSIVTTVKVDLFIHEFYDSDMVIL